MVDGVDPPREERRANHVLREVLDELIDHLRDVSKRHNQLTDEELDYAQERLQWLADEVWQLALKGDDSVA